MPTKYSIRVVHNDYIDNVLLIYLYKPLPVIKSKPQEGDNA